MKKFVAVAGNIGVGKSTLVTLLGRRLGWEPFFEAVAENPYLADFYRDMPAWSFRSQIFFLSTRLRSHRQLLDHPTSVVQDRSVYEDAEVFARNLYLQGALSAQEWSTYGELYRTPASVLPPPDLVIYIRASVETLTARIAKRGRDFESLIAEDYLRRLNTLYEEWIQSFTLAPVLTIPGDKLDFVEESRDLQAIVATVRRRLQDRQTLLFPYDM